MATPSRNHTEVMVVNVSPHLVFATVVAQGIAVFGLMSSPVAGQTTGNNVEAAMDVVMAGNAVLLCRHAKTRRMQEREPVDYADSTTQRLLSDEGKRQSIRMGNAFRTLGVPFSSVITSPMYRASNTAALMFDRPATVDSIWHTNGSRYLSPAVEDRIRVLQTPVSGGNVIIISHIGTMRNALGESPGNVGEGDCVVVKPGGDDFEIVGVLPWQEWIDRAR